MTAQFVIQIFLFLSAASCLILAGFVTYAIIGEINRKLPENEQIPYFIGQSGKYVPTYKKFQRIRGDYRKLYPNGRLVLYLNVLTFGGFGLMFAIAVGWAIGLFK